ncbi:hypothetical protein [Burkholderia ambifaria]|jgi:hypothetical protein|uniref:hypothetical protein n=1 Tax=Burkholderia ambifaria TaxID=152480 RepID=UPI00158CD8DA|nr:hypothetical protein [Burkholderia ambifaria]
MGIVLGAAQRGGAFTIVARAWIFAARAGGDCRYIHFFKRIRGARALRIPTSAFFNYCDFRCNELHLTLWKWNRFHL